MKIRNLLLTVFVFCVVYGFGQTSTKALINIKFDSNLVSKQTELTIQGAKFVKAKNAYRLIEDEGMFVFKKSQLKNIFSVGFRIYPLSVKEKQYLFSFTSSTQAGNYIQSVIIKNGNLYFETKEGKKLRIGEIQNNKWQWVFIRSGINGLKVNVNSKIIYENRKYKFLISENDSLIVGNKDKGGMRYRGYLSNLIIYNSFIDNKTINKLVKEPISLINQNYGIPPFIRLTFDKNKFLSNSDTLYFIPHGNAFISKAVNGINHNYIELNKNSFLKSSKSVQIGNDFSVSLHFRPKSSAIGQVLYFQKYKNNGYLKVGFDSDKVFVQFLNEKSSRKIIYCYDKVKKNGWNYLVLTFKHGSAMLYINETVIKEEIRISETNNKFTPFIFPDSCEAIYIGKGLENFEHFEGDIDEVILFKKERNAKFIRDLIKEEHKFDKALLEYVDNKLKSTEIFQGRQNKYQDTIVVNSRMVTLKVWDYDIIDNDSIAVYCNDEFVELVRLRRGLFKKKIKLKFVEKENRITFFSVNEGSFGKNTLKVKIEYDTKKIKYRELEIDKNNNGVLVVKTDIEEKKVFESSTTNDTILLKIWDSGSIDGDAISMIVNGKKILDKEYIKTKKEKDAIEVLVILDRKTNNKILFIAEDTGRKEPCTVKVKVERVNNESICKLKLGGKKDAFIIINKQSEKSK